MLSPMLKKDIDKSYLKHRKDKPIELKQALLTSENNNIITE